MSGHLMLCDWLVVLSTEKQELLVGGAGSQQNLNNFAQRLATTQTTNTAGPTGNVSITNTQLTDVATGGQSLLSIGGLSFPPLAGFNNLSLGMTTPINSMVSVS